MHAATLGNRLATSLSGELSIRRHLLPSCRLPPPGWCPDISTPKGTCRSCAPAPSCGHHRPSLLGLRRRLLLLLVAIQVCARGPSPAAAGLVAAPTIAAATALAARPTGIASTACTRRAPLLLLASIAAKAAAPSVSAPTSPAAPACTKHDLAHISLGCCLPAQHSFARQVLRTNEAPNTDSVRSDCSQLCSPVATAPAASGLLRRRHLSVARVQPARLLAARLLLLRLLLLRLREAIGSELALA